MNMNQNNKEDNKGIDLSHVLGDSSNRVKVEGEQSYNRSYYLKNPKVIQWVIKYSGGAIKDEKQASYVLLGLVAVAIIISLFLIFDTLKGPTISPKALEKPQYGLPIKD
jgi:hypothetical protein